MYHVSSFLGTDESDVLGLLRYANEKAGETVRIVTLIENTSSRPDITPRHGLSLYIETNGTKILFDMGQDETLLHNARHLGIDLSKVDIAVLSHGHYDHGGGLTAFLRINQKAPVYIHTDAFGQYYNGTQKYIGLDPALREEKRLIFTNGTVSIKPGLVLFDCNDLGWQSNAWGLNRKADMRFCPDDFRHEQYLQIREGEKQILISGCSHKGIDNIASYFQPDVLIGGFHLSKEEDFLELEKTASSLLAGRTRYYTGHCTGEKQYQFSTFLKHLSSEALVLTYAGIHGVTRDVEKKFNQILSIRKRIAANKRIDIYEVTPEMVHEVKPDYSARDIKAVFDYLDGRISVEKMLEEDGMEGEAFEDPNGEGPDLKNDVMDINVQKLFDLFLDRMSDLEKFFALIEIGCSDKYATMTVSQFSVDQTFLNIVAADKKYAKNIQTGDVVIKRPNRQAYTDRDVELKDVKFVGRNVVRYQREQTKLRWKKLKDVLTEDDIMGNKSVEYFQQKWEELIKKYENLC